MIPSSSRPAIPTPSTSSSIFRETTDLNWVLGGSASDFDMGEGADIRLATRRHPTRRWNPDSVRQSCRASARGYARAAARSRREDDEGQGRHRVPGPRRSFLGQPGQSAGIGQRQCIHRWAPNRYLEFTEDGKLLYDASFTGGSNYRPIALTGRRPRQHRRRQRRPNRVQTSRECT